MRRFLFFAKNGSFRRKFFMAVTGEIKKTTVEFSDFGKYENQIVTIKGTVHNVRRAKRYSACIPKSSLHTACRKN